MIIRDRLVSLDAFIDNEQLQRRFIDEESNIASPNVEKFNELFHQEGAAFMHFHYRKVENGY